MKNILLCLFCLLTSVAFAQVQRFEKTSLTKAAKARVSTSDASHTVTGEITGNAVSEDSIFFVTGQIDPKYYDSPIHPAKVTANAFKFNTAVIHPQMRRILLKSDNGIRIYRRGEYFIDKSTTTIAVDYLAQECNQVNGATAAEYRNKFIPFFYPANTAYNCQQHGFDSLLWDEDVQFDSILYEYVKANPSSYVALWNLIERFSKFGHSELREKILTFFSKDVKASSVWQMLNTDMLSTPVKQGAVFPSFSVKAISQPEKLLELPKAQYILVDFWFSRCQPCLEALPALKKLYATYQTKGFEIVSISTDRTQEVALWKKRIKEYELPWSQYLDENAVVSSKLSVYSFPTTFLFDNTGKVLLRNIGPEDLGKFLAQKLGK